MHVQLAVGIREQLLAFKSVGLICWKDIVTTWHPVSTVTQHAVKDTDDALLGDLHTHMDCDRHVPACTGCIELGGLHG